jgi:hypothetical protein
MAIELKVVGDGAVESSEGWAVRLLGPDLIEYRAARAACLVNVEYAPAQHACRIYASESASDLFPDLVEDLRRAAQLFKGHYIVI